MIQLPVGSIIAWHKTLANNSGRVTPNGWVVCDGIEQDIPTGSVYSTAGKFTPPDLRGVFLRGSTISGSLNDSETHRHYIGENSQEVSGDYYGRTAVRANAYTEYSEIKPPAITVVWLMKVI